MKEKELYVLKYVNEKINGNDDVEYNCDIEEEYAVKEIAHYLKRLISKGYIRGRNWAMINGEEVSVYKNKVFSIYYEKLVLTKNGREEINKK
ncbi:MAG TPA: hypothetical protein VIK26_05235 [Clostridium sp.]